MAGMPSMKMKIIIKIMTRIEEMAVMNKPFSIKYSCKLLFMIRLPKYMSAKLLKNEDKKIYFN